MTLDPQLAQIFRAESEERLTRLDSGFLTLEKNPGDQHLIEDLFRETHSLKGAARMLGLMQVEGTAHALESLLNAALVSASTLNAAEMESLDLGLKKLRREIEAVLATLDDTSPPQPERPPAAPPEAVTATATAAETAAEPSRSFHIDTVRVETDKLDDLLTLAGELGILRSRNFHRHNLMAQIHDLWSQLEQMNRRLLLGLSRDDPSRRVQERILERFDNLLGLVRDGAQEDAARFDSTLGRLQEQIQSARLLPLSVVFNLFPRMVRDLAKEQGKDIDLHLEGSDITLDKRILEEIKDPLMHVLRNAVDHGIESPAERRGKGKPGTGSIRIVANRTESSVTLAIHDDGRGLDLEAIRRTAIQRGLLDTASAGALTDEEVQQLIFSPGFSTAFQVTELSGRGIGLDVVFANIERLKGSIALESRPDRGMTMNLTLPVSLTSLRLLVVRAGVQSFGLPMDAVHKLQNLPRAGFYLFEGRTAVDLEGQPVFAPALAEILEIPGADGAKVADLIPCVFLQEGGQLLGLQIDEVLAEEEVVPRPLAPPLKRVRNITSLATLASGEICPVLKPGDLLRSSSHLTARISSPAMPAPPSAERPMILLVEDSALVRAMEKRIIEDAGYEVFTAVDGADALERIGSRPFAGVVSDIQMPNMDGLAFTARLREDTRYKDLPVILVSALDSDEDKRRGLQVGANAYIPKPSFDQRLLAETLKRLIGP